MSLILDPRGCKQNTELMYFSGLGVNKGMAGVHCIICLILTQGGIYLEEVRGSPNPRPELYRPSSDLLPLVTPLAGGERLFPVVHETR